MNKSKQGKKTSNKSLRETKMCLVCGRPFQNRKRWSSRNVWDKVLYCSEKCRKMKK